MTDHPCIKGGCGHVHYTQCIDALAARLALSATDRGSLFARLCETEARLAEAEEWIANARHHDNCKVVRGDELCTCGRAKLLRPADSADAVREVQRLGQEIQPDGYSASAPVCQHDLQLPNCTANVTSWGSAECSICQTFWELRPAVTVADGPG